MYFAFAADNDQKDVKLCEVCSGRVDVLRGAITEAYLAHINFIAGPCNHLI